MREAGRDVVVFDSLELSRREAVIDAPLVVGDIHDRDLVTATCNEDGVTQLVHFAAYKSVGESMESPARYWRNNVAGSVELIEACLAADVNDVVFSSSCSVYGTPEQTPGHRNGQDRSREHLRRDQGDGRAYPRLVRPDQRPAFGEPALPTPPARASTLGSAKTGPTATTFIPLAMKAVLLKDHKLKVFGDDHDTPDGTCIRDCIHVNDLADAHVKSLDSLANGGETVAVNVSTGVGSSVLDVLKATSAAAGEDVPYEIAPRRSDDPVTTFADPTFADKTLGWRAEHGLREIVDTAHAVHKSQVESGR